MSLQLSESKVPCLLCNIPSSRISCIHVLRNQDWAIVHPLFLCIHLSEKRKDFWPRKGNWFCYYARIGKSTNVSYPQMTTVLFKTETTRSFFRLWLCVELWSHRNFSLASTITADCAKHAKNDVSTHPIYPPVPPTSMLEIEMETLTRTDHEHVQPKYSLLQHWRVGARGMKNKSHVSLPVW